MCRGEKLRHTEVRHTEVSPHHTTTKARVRILAQGVQNPCSQCCPLTSLYVQRQDKSPMRQYKQVNTQIQRWSPAEGQNQGGLRGGSSMSTTSARRVGTLSLCSVAGAEGIEQRELWQEQTNTGPKGPNSRHMTPTTQEATPTPAQCPERKNA